MPRRKHRIPFRAVPLLAAAAVVLALAPQAVAKSYTDVPKTHWAYSAISSVTSKGSSGNYILDDYGTVFRPGQSVNRAEMARALVIAAGKQSLSFTPVPIADVPPDHPQYAFIQRALKLRFFGLKDGNFFPAKAVTASSAETLLVRWLKLRHSSYNWTLLSSLSPARWEPNVEWDIPIRSYLPWIVASRQLQLRVNHPSGSDAREVTPYQPVTRAEVASMFKRGYDLGTNYNLNGLATFAKVSFPPLSTRQKEVATFALKYIGYPYVWGGEYPTKNSPYGAQAAGGFDCSGFAFYVMKMHFGYPLTVDERGGSAMAKNAKPRITRAGLKCGDLIFFGPNGPSSTVSSIFHVGIYLGNGWFVHSTGSSDGVTIASLSSSTYWKTNFAWGRRLLKASELVVVDPAE